jgi:hypothetical protein
VLAPAFAGDALIAQQLRARVAAAAHTNGVTVPPPAATTALPASRPAGPDASRATGRLIDLSA